VTSVGDKQFSDHDIVINELAALGRSLGSDVYSRLTVFGVFMFLDCSGHLPPNRRAKTDQFSVIWEEPIRFGNGKGAEAERGRNAGNCF
jgi:hypothetical protein